MKPSLNPSRSALVFTVLAVLSLGAASAAFAHCDSLDGPIIPEAQAALESGDINPVLKWVRAQDEAGIREAYAQARALRGRGEDIRQLADRHFLETLIRVHREGEGAPYTGLKPAGHIDPAFIAADAALVSGNVDELAADISAAVRDAIHTRFAAAHEGKQHAAHDVDSGRAYVAAYVKYIHYIEGLHGYLAADEAHPGGAPACGGHAD